MPFVKTTGKKTIIVSVFIIFIYCSSLSNYRRSTTENVDEYYLAQLALLKKEILSFRDLAMQQADRSNLQSKFKSARLIYKRVAILTEYFNIYDSRNINGPAIERAEDDNPQKIIAAQGFQVMEQLIYEKNKPGTTQRLGRLADEMAAVIGKLETEPDRANKFTDEQVLDALRSGILRLVSLGISGYDSPIAQNSLTEAASTLEGTRDLLNIYSEKMNEKDPRLFPMLQQLLDRSVLRLKTATGFNSFDRLHFIRDCMNPLYEALLRARDLLGIAPLAGMSAVNLSSKNIFATDAFNINFFAPFSRYEITPERIELGRQLFYDPLLSGTRNRSCATCHKPELAFTDGLRTALAINNKTSLSRNTPTLLNSALQSRLFFDSRTDMLENQLNEVIHNTEEMKGSLKNSVKELKQSSHYYDLFKTAYAGNKDPLTEYNIANALASYVRSLTALNARFDQYMRGDENKLTPQEKKGFNLFMGKAHCGSCHFIPLFNGLVPPGFSETESEVLGIPKTTGKVAPVLDPDPGKYDFTGSAVDRFSFKTPTLRNIELTAPYMHNGVFKTLEEVLDFYNKGGGKGLKIAPPNQTLPFDKLNLTKNESAAVIAFMKALTDTVYHQPGR